MALDEHDVKRRPRSRDAPPGSGVVNHETRQTICPDEHSETSVDTSIFTPTGTQFQKERDFTARRLLGTGTSRLSDFINEHLKAVRLAASASIFLITAYGIAHSPVFFRYRTVAELPSKYFKRRKTLSCRVIKAEKDPANRTIMLYMRHLSPLERLSFSKSWYERLVSLQPSSILHKVDDDDPSQLLKVALAGLQWPSYEWDDGWFDQLVQHKTPVTCQCLARDVSYAQSTRSAVSPRAVNSATLMRTGPVGRRNKRPIPDIDGQPTTAYGDDQIAVCKIHYRPMDSKWKLLRLFQMSDLAESMVQHGRAITKEDTLYGPTSEEHVMVDMSDSLKDLQRDAAYFEQLSNLEYQAARKYRGIWSDLSYRENREDVVDKIDFQAVSTIFNKLMRWLRGG
ncbi:hypothetical protein MPSEU_000895200 [Mayamaea pseudoterrestris]|nr:hypothetical protein MPSEU_000895200 [Mayamaea pseudoterrestris]